MHKRVLAFLKIGEIDEAREIHDAIKVSIDNLLNKFRRRKPKFYLTFFPRYLNMLNNDG